MTFGSGKYNYTICHWDECYAKPKKIKYVLHVEKKK